MFRYKEVPVPLYGGTLVIVDADSWEPIKKRYKGIHFGDEGVDLYGAWGHYGEGVKDGYTHVYYFLIFNTEHILQREGLPGMFDYISHEAVHVKNYLFVKCRLQNCQSNDEAEAHLVGWLSAEAARFLLAKKKEKKYTHEAITI